MIYTPVHRLSHAPAGESFTEDDVYDHIEKLCDVEDPT